MQVTSAGDSGTLRKVTRPVVTIFVLLLVMTGCASARPHLDWTMFTAEDAIGSWCGPEGDTLTISDDEGFVLSSISREFLEKLKERRRSNDPVFGPPDPESASGTWDTYERNGTLRVGVDFYHFDRKTANFSIELFPSRRKDDDKEVLLYYANQSDLGSIYEFSRCESRLGSSG